jgi:hypothetical protein
MGHRRTLLLVLTLLALVASYAYSYYGLSSAYLAGPGGLLVVVACVFLTGYILARPRLSWRQMAEMRRMGRDERHAHESHGCGCCVHGRHGWSPEAAPDAPAPPTPAPPADTPKVM